MDEILHDSMLVKKLQKHGSAGDQSMLSISGDLSFGIVRRNDDVSSSSVLKKTITVEAREAFIWIDDIFAYPPNAALSVFICMEGKEVALEDFSLPVQLSAGETFKIMVVLDLGSTNTTELLYSWILISCARWSSDGACTLIDWTIRRSLLGRIAFARVQSFGEDMSNSLVGQRELTSDSASFVPKSLKVLFDLYAIQGHVGPALDPVNLAPKEGLEGARVP